MVGNEKEDELQINQQVGEESKIDVCTEYLTYGLKNRKVKRVMESLEQYGCKIPNDFFQCIKCDTEMAIGGFSPAQEIAICQNVIEKNDIPKKMVVQTMIHELLHAFDECRTKLDWTNCYHLACTEVRASNLSGDCSMVNEMSRGNFSVQGQGQRCIKRRAILSVSSHEQCKDKASEYVESVYNSCIKDLAPFLNR